MDNNLLTMITISDIHFGVIDPKFMYKTLTRDFTNRIANISFNILAICGDLFDMKMMSNNPAISYAIQFISDLVAICSSKNATIILLDGTQSHDNGQLSLFYHYLADPSIDFRIIENIQFEDIQGMRVLCIPERYGIPEDEYKNILFNSKGYDFCILHGTYKGSFHGTDIATLNSNHAPVFGIGHFENCSGPIFMGHYHIAGCYDEHAYYNGSALRFRFGEEQPKGYLVTVFDKLSRRYYTELIQIHSHIYETINIDDIMNRDPKEIIEYIKNQKISRGIDYIRIQFNNPNENMEIVKNYFRNYSNYKLQDLSVKDRQIQQMDQEMLRQNEQYSYLTDNSLSDYDKFVKYVNQNEGYEFITVDELINLLEEDL